jgi:hypothetical protein
MAVAATLLVAAMLSIMAARVAGPFGAGQRLQQGRPVVEHRLDFRERLLLHRHSVYALGLVLVLGAVTGAIPRAVELVGILGAIGIAAGVPVAYRLTEHGIGLNGVVFRPWSELGAVEDTSRGLTLRGRAGAGDFKIICLRGTARAALRRQAARRTGRGETGAEAGPPRPATASGRPHHGAPSDRAA